MVSFTALADVAFKSGVATDSAVMFSGVVSRVPGTWFGVRAGTSGAHARC
jgi:hypothetical protein